jgi:hypothetical protein
MGLFVLISAAHPEERRDLLAAGPGVVLEDLEPIVVEVGPRATDGLFHLAGRTFANAEELAPVLRKLAQPGERASVRLGDDSRFEDVEKAIRACEIAGFAAVALITEATDD